MEWLSGKINIDLDAMFPSDKRFRNKYVMGAKLLLFHKNALINSGDHNYSNFIDLYEKIEKTSILDFDRAYILFQAAQATIQIRGSSAECGVYKGGSSVLIANVSPERKHYALDTFEGFPDVISNADVLEKEEHFSDVSIAEIQKMFGDYKNIVMLKGKFSESFEKMYDEIFSFVYIDADLYVSTVECLNFFYPRLSKGGIMLFDDYLLPITAGVKKAVDEFFAAKDEFPIVLPTCQAIVFKV